MMNNYKIQFLLLFLFCVFLVPLKGFTQNMSYEDPDQPKFMICDPPFDFEATDTVSNRTVQKSEAARTRTPKRNSTSPHQAKAASPVRMIMIPKDDCSGNPIGNAKAIEKGIVPSGTKLSLQMGVTSGDLIGKPRGMTVLVTMNDVTDANGKVLIPAGASVGGYVFPGHDSFSYGFTEIRFRNELGGVFFGHINAVFEKQADVLPIQRGKSIILSKSNPIDEYNILYSPIREKDVFTVRLVSNLNLSEGGMDVHGFPY